MMEIEHARKYAILLGCLMTGPQSTPLENIWGAFDCLIHIRLLEI